jgi:hypothetical protein
LFWEQPNSYHSSPVFVTIIPYGADRQRKIQNDATNRFEGLNERVDQIHPPRGKFHEQRDYFDERREHFSERPDFRREFSEGLAVAAIYDRRKRRSQSAAMAKSLKLYHYRHLYLPICPCLADLKEPAKLQSR